MATFGILSVAKIGILYLTIYNLSHRLLVVGLVAVLLNICLLFCLYVATKELGGRWLGLIVITAAALAVLMWCTAVWTIRPFLRLEKKTRLFLGSVHISGIVI